jgi:hypothetical protein
MSWLIAWDHNGKIREMRVMIKRRQIHAMRRDALPIQHING